MKNNERGITLVALVVTIIILIILATVSISMVLGQNGLINRARQAREMTINEQTSENGIYGQGEDYINSYLIGSTTGESSSTTPTTPSTPTTYTAYAVGDVVTLGGEDFYVIEASDESTASVKLLTKYNVKTTSGEGQYTQTSNANTLIFDYVSNDYTTSEIAKQVGYYKTALEGRMGAGKTIQEARLMTREEIDALGASNSYTSACPTFVNTRKYWLNCPSTNDGEYYSLTVQGNYDMGTLMYDMVNSSMNAGMRPVVVVLKSNI